MTSTLPSVLRQVFWTLLAALSGACAYAADAPAAAPKARPVVSAAAAQPSNEPFVQQTVIEDDRARIEELRVRGQLQRVTVAPKGRAPAYEIVTGSGSRDLGTGEATSRGTAGKRVWNVLRF